MYYDGYKKKEGFNYFQYSSTAQSISKVSSFPHICRINIFQTKHKNICSISNLFLLNKPLGYYIITILLPLMRRYLNKVRLLHQADKNELIKPLISSIKYRCRDKEYLPTTCMH